MTVDDGDTPRSALTIPRGPVTVWFVSTPDLAQAVAHLPAADRGFGRKFLAHHRPGAPISIFGQFPLNRSAEAGEDEYYIGGFPGFSVIQLVLDYPARLSRLPEWLLTALPADRIYAFAHNPTTGRASYAHYEHGALRRSFSATPARVIEDLGLPLPCEGPFWAGDYPPDGDRLPGHLPFAPQRLLTAVQDVWLGVDVSAAGPDIPVVAYATDGRPEPTSAHPVAAAPPVTSTPLTAADPATDYDDYEVDEQHSQWGRSIIRSSAAQVGDWATEAGEHARQGGRDVSNGARTLWGRVTTAITQWRQRRAQPAPDSATPQDKPAAAAPLVDPDGPVFDSEFEHPSGPADRPQSDPTA